jgi:carbon starvation protein CstA
MIQDLLGHVYAPLGHTESAFSNVVATMLCVAGWGWFVYQGTVDPLGGVNTIWPLFGISNQMLAGIALLLATTILIKLKRERYAWVTLAPTAWLLVCTLTAGWMKAFSSDPRIGFFALANSYSMFVVLVVIMAYFTIKMSLQALRTALPSAAETPPMVREGGIAHAPA